MRLLLADLVGGSVLACLLLTQAGVAFAQSPAQPDPREAQPERPTIATHAFAVAPGIVEIEAGIQARPRFDTLGLIKIGLSDNLQLDIAPGWARDTEGPRSRLGLTDTALGLKWHVADDVPVLASFAVQPSVTLPTGSEEDGFGSGETAFNLLFVSSRSLRGIAIDVNAGGTFRRETESSAAFSAMWAVAATAPLTERWDWTAEVFGYPGTTGPAGEPPLVALLTGPVFTLSKQLMLDAGVIVSLKGFGKTAFYSGLTWNATRLWTPQ